MKKYFYRYGVYLTCVAIFVGVIEYLLKNHQPEILFDLIPSNFIGWLGLLLLFVGIPSGFSSGIRLLIIASKDFEKANNHYLMFDLIFFQSCAFIGLILFLLHT